MRETLSHGVYAALAALNLFTATPAFGARDVLLVLDNSGSMRRNDPARLGAAAVAQFVLAQAPDTRIGILLFADAAELVVPLTAAGAIADPLKQALARLDYRGRRTQTAGAMERALYELREEGRPDAGKAIVLMTDGIIDTGDQQRDTGQNEWLRRDLAAQAAREQVRIFGIAFTEGADYQLLQALALATNAEYFRVLSADSLGKSLKRIETVFATPPSSAVSTIPEPSAAAATGHTAEAARSTTIESAVGTSGFRRYALALAAILLLTLAGIGWHYRAELSAWSKEHGGFGADEGPRATLVDIYSGTGARNYLLGGRPVVLGRLMGKDRSRDYVVVPEKTVGRWHASIERRGATFWIRDERSVNGTFINDERLSGERPLKHEDKVRLHIHEFRFLVEEMVDLEATVILPARRASG